MKLTKSSVKKKLHKLWSEVVRSRDKYICQWCYKQSKFNHAHHVVSKGIGNIWSHFAVENGIVLCFRCHIFRLKNDVDGYIKFRDNWLEKRDLTYEELRTKFTKPIISPVTIDDYLVIYNSLKKQLLEMQTNAGITIQENWLPVLPSSKKRSRKKQDRA